MDFDYNHSSQEMQIDEVIKNKKTKQSKRKKSSNVSEKYYLEIMKLLFRERSSDCGHVVHEKSHFCCEYTV